MNNYKARVEYTITDGSAKTYNFPFSYIENKFVCVKTRDVNNVETVLTYGVDYTVDDLKITLTNSQTVGNTLIIYRQTSTDKIVDWNDGSILLASNMTLEEVQLLHINEEQQDYIIANSIYRTTDSNNKVSWDGQNLQLSNVSDPTLAQDVVTKHYMESVQDGFVTANTELKNTCTTMATNAATSATSSATSATSSQKWAESTDSPDNNADTDSTTGKTQSSRTWAIYSKTEAIVSANSASASANSASASSTSASAAKTSETNAATSANAAASSAAGSLTSANNSSASSSSSASSAAASAYSASAAKTSATNAATSETNAYNYMTNANTAMDVCNSIKADLTNVFHWKGSVDTYAALPASPSAGDVYNIAQEDTTHGIKAGDNVVWTVGASSSYWDDFSGAVSGVVKSVNGITPDTSGNVAITNADTVDGFHARVGASYFNKIPVISDSDGVLEIGPYIDMHPSSNDTSDYNVRIEATSNSSISIAFGNGSRMSLGVD